MGEATGCRTDPFASCPRRRAGCACAARKEAGTGGCVGIVRRVGTGRKAKVFRRDRQSVRFRCQKRRCTRPETGERHPPSRALQRDRSRGQKPLNGALKGATYIISVEAALSAPSELLFETPRAAKPLRGYWCAGDRPRAELRQGIHSLCRGTKKAARWAAFSRCDRIEPIIRRRLQRPSSWPVPSSSERRLRLPELRPWRQPSSSAQPSWSPCRRRLRRRRVGLPWKRSCPLP